MTHAELVGKDGERLTLSFRRKESWGDLRLLCTFKAAWAEVEIEVLVEIDRLEDFAEKLHVLTKHNSGSFVFLNLDGNCEITCTAKPNGNVEVVAHLMPNMTSDNLFNSSFVVGNADSEAFASKVTLLTRQAVS